MASLRIKTICAQPRNRCPRRRRRHDDDPADSSAELTVQRQADLHHSWASVEEWKRRGSLVVLRGVLDRIALLLRAAVLAVGRAMTVAGSCIVSDAVIGMLNGTLQLGEHNGWPWPPELMHPRAVLR
jgi:hypothetical protein